MKRRIVLVGKSGSGKDYARKLLVEMGADYPVPFTTRPPRENEVMSVDYHFISEEMFQEMKDADSWYVSNEFIGWHYGITKQQFATERGLFIMSPAAVSRISSADRAMTNVVYIDVPANIRKKRMAERIGNADSVERRLDADEKDFSNFRDYDLCIMDPAFGRSLIEIIYNKSFN
jgi:guanylate kinase